MLISHTHGAGEPAAEDDVPRSPGSRRAFLKWSGTAAAVAMIAACDRTPTENSTDLSPSAAATKAGTVTIDLGTDLGILNFAYALEQLEAAFYIQAVSSPYAGVNSQEMQLLRDIKKHEVVHREFFQTALGKAAIPNLKVDFSKIDFGSRQSVLAAAKAFEDTGVGAYNGAAQFLRKADYLVVAGKIVSVEARHASAIRDVLGNTFAPDQFDSALTFEQVLRRAGPFITTTISLANSPTAGQAARQGSATGEMTS